MTPRDSVLIIAPASEVCRRFPQTVAATVLAMPSGGMGGSTGVPMAVALSLFANGEIGRRGVFAPEAVIDPNTFFNELAPLCTPAKNDVSDMVLATMSE